MVLFDNQSVYVEDLAKINKDLSVTVSEGYSRLGRELNFNEILKVSINEEGSRIKFETLDQISIIVSANHADGPFNKID